MKYPNIVTVKSVLDCSSWKKIGNGRWALARPLGYPSFLSRLHAAWLVFTGKADALKWEEQ